VGHGPPGRYASRGIVSVCLGAEFHPSRVLLLKIQDPGHKFGGLPDTDQKDTFRFRVQGARVACLDTAEKAPHPLQDLV
jgi:hypothetical protein